MDELKHHIDIEDLGLNWEVHYDHTRCRTLLTLEVGDEKLGMWMDDRVWGASPFDVMPMLSREEAGTVILRHLQSLDRMNEAQAKCLLVLKCMEIEGWPTPAPTPSQRAVSTSPIPKPVSTSPRGHVLSRLIQRVITWINW